MTMNSKKIAGAGLAALVLAGSMGTFSTPAAAQWCRHHYCGPGYYRGPGVLPFAAGVVGGVLGTAAAVATGGCWRHDGYGRPYRVC